LTILRTVLLFAPILCTWYGISRATSQYSQYLEANPDAPASSFFRLWMSGFEGSTWLSFDRLAMVIVVLLTLLIGTSAILDWHRAEDESPGDAAALQYRLAMVLADAARHLADGGVPSLEREVKRVLTGVNKLVGQVRDAATSASAALSEITAAGTAAAKLVEGARTSTDKITLATTHLTAGLNDSVGHLASSVADVRSATIDLRTDVGTLRENVGDLGSREDENRENVGRLLADHRDFLEQTLAAMAGRPATRQTADLEARIQELGLAISQMGGVLRQFGERATMLAQAPAPSALPALPLPSSPEAQPTRRRLWFLGRLFL
jgi:hypothetical protein